MMVRLESFTVRRIYPSVPRFYRVVAAPWNLSFSSCSSPFTCIDGAAEYKFSGPYYRKISLCSTLLAIRARLLHRRRRLSRNIGREKKRGEKKTRHFNRETNNCCTVTTSIFRNDAKQNGTERGASSTSTLANVNSCVSLRSRLRFCLDQFDHRTENRRATL